MSTCSGYSEPELLPSSDDRPIELRSGLEAERCCPAAWPGVCSGDDVDDEPDGFRA